MEIYLNLLVETKNIVESPFPLLNHRFKNNNLFKDKKGKTITKKLTQLHRTAKQSLTWFFPHLLPGNFYYAVANKKKIIW